jgi:hypothetical protein
MRATALFVPTGVGTGTALVIHASDIFHVKGMITKVTQPTGTTPGSIVITTATGTAVTLSVPNTTRISVDGVGGKTIANLTTVMRAEAIYQATGTNAGTALVIEASDIFHVKGMITKVTQPSGTTPGSIVITPTTGPAVTLTVTATTKISLDGVAGKTIANLTVGMTASAVYQATGTNAGTALHIAANDIFRVTGTITKVTPASGTTPGSIVITPTTGPAVTLTVTATTAISVDGVKNKTLADLAVGMQATSVYTVTGLNTGTATSIAAKSMLKVTGTITKVTQASGTTPGSIVITPTTGPAVTLTVPANTPISVDDVKGKTLADLTTLMRATATYTVTGLNTGTATKIDATDIFTIKGTITKVTQPSGTTPGSIVITPTTGAAVTLTVNANTVIRIGDHKKTIADLKVGQKAEATYKATATNAGIALRIHVSSEDGDHDHDD